MNEEKPQLVGILGRANSELLVPNLKNLARNLPFILNSFKVLDIEFPGTFDDFVARLKLLNLELNMVADDPGRFPWFWRPVVDGEHDWATHALVVVLPDRGRTLRFYTMDVQEIPADAEWALVETLLIEEYMSLDPDKFLQVLEFYREGDKLRQLPETKQELLDLFDSMETWLENPNLNDVLGIL